MKLPDPAAVAARLTNRFGVAVAARVEPASTGTTVRVMPSDLHPHEGFVVEATLGWRSIESRFSAGPYAGGLVSQLGTASPEERRIASAFLQSMEKQGGRVTFQVNREAQQTDQPADWPTQEWTSIDLSVRRTGVVVDELSEAEVAEAITSWCGGILGVVIALARVEETAAAVEKGIPEGARQTVIVNRYERSRVNRAACMAALGTSCLACGFDFRAVYGPEAEGFIHVHHVRPVSELGRGYIVDPTRDLVPVCPTATPICTFAILLTRWRRRVPPWLRHRTLPWDCSTILCGGGRCRSRASVIPR